MRAIFRICGNESQPGLQNVKKLATLLLAVPSDQVMERLKITYATSLSHYTCHLRSHLMLEF